MAKIGIVYYSMYGETFELARAIAEGVTKGGGEAHLRRVPDPLLPDEVKESDGVKQAIEAQAEIPVATVDELPEFDGLIIGSPTRFGSATSQLQAFLDQTGPLWSEGKLLGKAAGFFTGAATIHGGHETTIMSMATFAMHQGMPIVPAGYAVAGDVQGTRSGGGPYGPTQLGTGEGLTDEERNIALDYGAHFAGIAEKLAA
ncbi:MAG: NAD(P)H:quinone oxidoreductase [Nitriliruptoraceae bacterium]|nr:NAD(P)H:quinone oxidoreductase [Nitriliruptoraceae bacterium]